MIAKVYNISIFGEFKILRFTVDNYIDETLSTTVTYEIAPSIKTEGVWLPSDDSLVSDPELKEIVNNHLINWPADLRAEYERYKDNLDLKNSMQQTTLSDEEIDQILRDLL